MGEDIIDMDLNMEGGRKETDEEGKEIAAGTDRSASEQTAPYEAEAAGTEQHIEDDEEIPQLIMEHWEKKVGRFVLFSIWTGCTKSGFWTMLPMLFSNGPSLT